MDSAVWPVRCGHVGRGRATGAASRCCTNPSGRCRTVFDFRAACERHDFGYRNEKRQGRFTEESRHRIDDVFRADMDAVCAPQSGWFGWRERLCGRVAGDYYFWVRSCGANPAPYCPLVARDWVEERVES